MDKYYTEVGEGAITEDVDEDRAVKTEEGIFEAWMVIQESFWQLFLAQCCLVL